MSKPKALEGLTGLEKGKVLYDWWKKTGQTQKWIATTYGLKHASVRRLISTYRRAATAEYQRRKEAKSYPKVEVEARYPETLEDLELMGFDADDMREADIEELIDIARRTNRQMEKIDPVVTHKEIVIETKKPVAILLAGCMQIGGRWTFHDMVQTKFDEMLTLPETRLGLFGDEIENFKSGSFAGARSVFDQVLSPPLQRKLFEHWFDKVYERTLFGTSSQHGTQWNEKQDNNPIKQMYLDRDVPFFDGQFYIKLRVGETPYNLAGSHEFPGSSMYNKLHPHKRAMWQRYPNADIIVQADKHQYAASEEDAYHNEWLAGNRATPFVTMIQIGTAKGGPDPYTIRSWSRGVTVWPWLVLWPEEHRVETTRRFDNVLMWTQGHALEVAT